MRRREKLFWLCAGAALIVLLLSLIPSYYEICEISEKTKEEHCARYQVAQFLGIKIPQFLDRMGGVLTALATLAIAAFTLTLKRSTDRLWDAGERQLKLAADTAAAQSRDMQASIKTAEEANRLNKETFIASQRPWLNVEASLVSDYTSDGESAAVQLQVHVTHVAGPPALNVVCNILTFPNTEVGTERDHYRRLSDMLKKMNTKNSGYGVMLFPQRTMEASKPSTLATWYKKSIDIGNAKGAVLQLGALGICVCVDYFSPVDDNHYQMGFIYLLFEFDAANRITKGFDLTAREIPREQLRLERHPLGTHNI